MRIATSTDRERGQSLTPLTLSYLVRSDSVDDVGFMLGGKVGRELMALFFWLCASFPSTRSSLSGGC